MEIIASVEAGDMKYAVAERQADDNAAFLDVEEANMSEVTALEIPITVSICLSGTAGLNCYIFVVKWSVNYAFWTSYSCNVICLDFYVLEKHLSCIQIPIMLSERLFIGHRVLCSLLITFVFSVAGRVYFSCTS